MKYIIVDPDIQNGIELKKYLDSCERLDFQGSYTMFNAAKNYCLEHPPDIAFIKLGQAQLNAFKLTAVIRERNQFVKVIFMSSQRENAVEAFEQEADGFLLVPLDQKKIDQLLQQI